MSQKITKTEEEWRKELTPEQYQMLREKGTEAAFTGKYYNHKDKGVYVCAGCGQELFSSKHKYDSGSGWPSFYAAAQEGVVKLHEDTSHGMTRTEVVCARCNGHLGHLFPDGPPDETGERYCINSACLKFKDND